MMLRVNLSGEQQGKKVMRILLLTHSELRSFDSSHCDGILWPSKDAMVLLEQVLAVVVASFHYLTPIDTISGEKESRVDRFDELQVRSKLDSL